MAIPEIKRGRKPHYPRLKHAPPGSFKEFETVEDADRFRAIVYRVGRKPLRLKISNYCWRVYIR